MSHLIDTDWVVDYLKGRAPAVALLTGLFEQGLALSVITFAETYEGIYYGSDPRGNEAIFRRFLVGVRVLPVTRTIGRRFALLRGQLR